MCALLPWKAQLKTSVFLWTRRWVSPSSNLPVSTAAVTAESSFLLQPKIKQPTTCPRFMLASRSELGLWEAGCRCSSRAALPLLLSVGQKAGWEALLNFSSLHITQTSSVSCTLRYLWGRSMSMAVSWGLGRWMPMELMHIPPSISLRALCEGWAWQVCHVLVFCLFLFFLSYLPSFPTTSF